VSPEWFVVHPAARWRVALQNLGRGRYADNTSPSPDQARLHQGSGGLDWQNAGRESVKHIPAYHIEVRPLPKDEGGGYLAWVPDLPGCMSDGESAPEAVQNAERAILEWIEEAERLGQIIPEPSQAASTA
jgi:antitoxin HicB